VLPDNLLDALGPSLIGHQSLFLYGGTGNGKTSIAERILRIYTDTVLVPYCVEVDGHIITLFDPVVHQRSPSNDELLDPRWAVCKRPCITVGGELSSTMLELQLDESTRCFIAPFQMKANNGILIIDDFGRQMVAPRELLNRWVVPLDRRVDYLTLSSGMKFQVPFEVMVVFSTNMNPHDLADEAFLRRIQTKVLVDNVSAAVFDQIFHRVAQAHQVPCEPGCAEYLRQRCAAAGYKFLRACYPNDIYRLVKAISEYEGRAVRMTRANIDRAVGLYFAPTDDENRSSVLPDARLFPSLTRSAPLAGTFLLFRRQSMGCRGSLGESLRASPRLICARRLPVSRFAAAFSFAASLTWMRLFTASAPAALAMRVALPLCCMTPVLPSMVATPPCTWT
jgi:hypothetical protein